MPFREKKLLSVSVDLEMKKQVETEKVVSRQQIQFEDAF